MMFGETLTLRQGKVVILSYIVDCSMVWYSPANLCFGDGIEMQHRMAEAFLTASSKNGDSAAALTASEARCISD